MQIAHAGSSRAALIAWTWSLLAVAGSTESRRAQIPGRRRQQVRRPQVDVRPHQVRHLRQRRRRRHRASQYWDEPWAIDAPAAEQNLSRRIKSVTAIDVGDPIVLTLEDPKLWEHPWIYIVEPSNLVLKDTEVPILREFLLRGGTLTFDDFHGPFEWELTEKQLKRVFPDREIVEIAPPHPIYTCFYRIDKYPQIPGLGSFLSGRTWEKGGFTAHLRGILDDKGRPMVLINWNTDMGDGVEWSNAQEYQGYIKWTAQAYQMLINEVIYSLTH